MISAAPPRFDAELIRRNTPQELRADACFVTYRLEDTGKPKLDKIPYSPRSGTRALPDSQEEREKGHNPPATWGSFDEAVEAALKRDHDGIGRELREGGGIAGIDYDNCRNPDTGAIHPDVLAEIREWNSYTEISPSGRGIRVFVLGKKPGGRCKWVARGWEMYDHARFLTITGQHLAGTPLTVESRQGVLDIIYARWFAPKSATQPSSRRPSDSPLTVLSVEQIKRIIGGARNSGKYGALMAGNASDYPDDSPDGVDLSSADMALANMLAFYTDDYAKIEQIMNGGVLGSREKWRSRPDYRERTINKALDACSEHYSGPTLTTARPYTNGAHPEPAPSATPGAPPGDAPPQDAALNPADERPVVRVLTGREHEAVAAIVNHITTAQAAAPQFFSLEGMTNLYRLATIERDGREYRTIVPVESAYVRDAITRNVALERWNERKHDFAPTSPTDVLVGSVAAFLPERCPPLAGVTEIPVYRADGDLQTEPGYDPLTRLYYSPPPGLSIPSVPKTPTAAARTAAVALIDELIGDFDFAGPAERHNAIALFLLPYARPFVNGATPLHLLESPVPGSGKSLLLDCLLRPAYGQIAFDKDLDEDAETSKWLIAQALSGRPYVCIDNVKTGLDSGVLSSAVTGTLLSGRVLGGNTIVNLRFAPVWAVTGNNPLLTDEIARRVVRIRLEPQTDRPGIRLQSEFRHVLPNWADERRAELVHAGLTLVAAWLAAGKPVAPHERNKGSFTNWARVLGGILHVAGLGEFLGNEDAVWVNANVDAGVDGEFVELWAAKFGFSGANTSSELLEVAYEAGLLNKDAKGTHATSLGRRLIKMRDKLFSLANGERVQIKQLGLSHQAKVYGLRPAARPSGPQDTPPTPPSGEDSEFGEFGPNSPIEFAYQYTNMRNTHESIVQTPYSPYPPQETTVENTESVGADSSSPDDTDSAALSRGYSERRDEPEQTKEECPTCGGKRGPCGWPAVGCAFAPEMLSQGAVL